MKIKRMTQRISIFILSIILFVGSGTFSVLMPPIKVHASNNIRETIAAIAEAEVGVSGGNRYYNSGESGAWCAYFARWCVRQAGIDNSIYPDTGSTNGAISWFQSQGQWHNKCLRTWSYAPQGSSSDGTWDNYIPQPGDFAAIENSYDGSNNSPEHTALVVGVDENWVYTVEGNISNKVVARKYDLETLHLNGNRSSSTYIVGFGEPAYDDSDFNIDFGMSTLSIEQGESFNLPIAFSGQGIAKVSYSLSDSDIVCAYHNNCSWAPYPDICYLDMTFIGTSPGTTTYNLYFHGDNNEVIYASSLSIIVAESENVDNTSSFGNVSISPYSTVQLDLNGKTEENLVLNFDCPGAAYINVIVSQEGIVEQTFGQCTANSLPIYLSASSCGETIISYSICDSNGIVIAEQTLRVRVYDTSH